jgi:cell division transport system permease protein
MIGSFFFLIRETWLNLWRQGLMALASITTATISLTIVGVFVVLGCQTYAILYGAPRQLEVHAFLSPDASRERAEALAREAETLAGVTRVTLVPREQAWAQWSKDYQDVLDGFKGNPFPDKLEIKAATPEQTLAVADWIRRMPGVDKVNEAREVLRQWVAIFNVARTVALALGLLLALGSAAIISNAIRMTLFARRRDIRVMQLVGATNGFIRFPFVLEGMVEGALGGAFASALLAGALQYYSTRVVSSVLLAAQFHLPLDLPIFCASLVLGGAVIGMLGSLVSVRKFLHAV